MAQIILTAEYAFSFRDVPNEVNSKYKIKLTNQVTVNSTKLVEEAKKIDSKAIIPLPPPPIEGDNKVVEGALEEGKK